jgi:hypothetical protein
MQNSDDQDNQQCLGVPLYQAPANQDSQKPLRMANRGSMKKRDRSDESNLPMNEIPTEFNPMALSNRSR